MKEYVKDIIKIAIIFAGCTIAGYELISKCSAMELLDEKIENHYECDDYIYHVGEVFHNKIHCFTTITSYMLNDYGKTIELVDTYEITDDMRNSYEGIILSKSGKFMQVMIGDPGQFRTEFYVYKYGDVTGDFDISLEDVVNLHKIINEDDSAITDYMFNANMNFDNYVDMIDVRLLLEKLCS